MTAAVSLELWVMDAGRPLHVSTGEDLTWLRSQWAAFKHAVVIDRAAREVVHSRKGTGDRESDKLLAACLSTRPIAPAPKRAAYIAPPANDIALVEVEAIDVPVERLPTIPPPPRVPADLAPRPETERPGLHTGRTVAPRRPTRAPSKTPAKAPRRPTRTAPRVESVDRLAPVVSALAREMTTWAPIDLARRIAALSADDRAMVEALLARLGGGR